MITSDTIVVRNADIVAGFVDDELIAMYLDSGEIFGLDGIATDIWRLAESPVRVSDLIDQLVADYDVDRATCIAEVLPFLDQLIEFGMVQVSGQVKMASADAQLALPQAP